MKKRIAIPVIILMLLLVFSSCKSSNETSNTNTSAQNREAKSTTLRANKLMAEMDANKDNKLSKEEVNGPLAKDFSKIDTNSDGFLSKAELENAPKPNRRQQNKIDKGQRT